MSTADVARRLPDHLEQRLRDRVTATGEREQLAVVAPYTGETVGEAPLCTAEGVGPLFYEPTVLTGLLADATAACEETFGPVVSVTPVAGSEKAIAKANDTEYSLHASVWTGDTGRGRAVARNIEAGSVSVNDAYLGLWASTDAPMGGVDDSGIGRRHGRQGIVKYTESQTVTTQRGPTLTPQGGMPKRLLGRGAVGGVRLLRWLRRHWPGGP